MAREFYLIGLCKTRTKGERMEGAVTSLFYEGERIEGAVTLWKQLKPSAPFASVLMKQSNTLAK